MHVSSEASIHLVLRTCVCSPVWYTRCFAFALLATLRSGWHLWESGLTRATLPTLLVVWCCQCLRLVCSLIKPTLISLWLCVWRKFLTFWKNYRRELKICRKVTLSQGFRRTAVSGRSPQSEHGDNCMEMPSNPAGLLMSLAVTGRQPSLGLCFIIYSNGICYTRILF